MNRIGVELAGTSPTLHNNVVVRGEDPGWQPKDDREQAASRLYRWYDGILRLPATHLVVAIGRAAWSKHRLVGARWPRHIVHAEKCLSLQAECVEFHGDWTPHVFARQDMPPVALPRFDQWSATFTLAYDPKYHDEATLRTLLEHSGRHIGLPQFATFAGPGPWGRFEIAKWEPVASVARAEMAGV